LVGWLVGWSVGWLVGCMVVGLDRKSQLFSTESDKANVQLMLLAYHYMSVT
jgi:hypothetical protein